MASQNGPGEWLSQFFIDPKYSDLTVQCGGRRWRVHKIVVCAQSPFFDKACSGQFKEANSNVVNLEEDEPDIVNAMLHFLYTKGYDETAGGDALSPLLLNVRVHTLADKYDIPALCKLANKKFASRATKEPATHAFAASIEEIFATGSHGKEQMQKSAVGIAATYAEDVMADGTSLRKVAESTPKFAAELVAEVVHREKERRKMEPSGPRYECSNCLQTVRLPAREPTKLSAMGCPYCGGSSIRGLFGTYEPIFNKV